MTDQPRPDPQLDNDLADFTDRLLKEEEVGVQVSTYEPDLIELEQTVIRLKAAARAAQPDAATAGRIRARLLKEWPKAAARPSWTWTWPRLAVAGATAVLVLAAALLLDKEPGDGTLTGASGLSGSGETSLLWLPVILLLGIILIIWLIGSNRK